MFLSEWKWADGRDCCEGFWGKYYPDGPGKCAFLDGEEGVVGNIRCGEVMCTICSKPGEYTEVFLFFRLRMGRGYGLLTQG